MADRMGDFLAKIGAMQVWQVEDVLRLQGAGDPRLFGEIAVELRYIDDDAVQKYVTYRETEQRR